MLLAEKKEKIHAKTRIWIQKLNIDNVEEAEALFNDLIDVLIEEVHETQEQQVKKSDMAELIYEIRNGFHLMERRFEMTDERFENMQKSMDKRFENMQKSMDKRFEDMQKYLDKRFEDMNKRIAFMQWLMLFGFTLVGAVIAVLKFYQS